jgi:hypothetical protein
MKTEMAMLPNGNYESIVSPIQHECISKDIVGRCVEYAWDKHKLYLELESGDPYEDGWSLKMQVNYCPFCGYKVSLSHS